MKFHSGFPVAAIGLAAATALVGVLGAAQGAQPDGAELFRDTVQPLIAKRCAACHNSTQRSGGLDLSSQAALRKGGANGMVLVVGKPDASLLYRRVSTREMPPGMPLSGSEVDAVRRWIAAGAAWPAAASPVVPLRGSASAAIWPGSTSRAGADWWSLRRPHLPAVPAVRHSAWVRNPIDAFILAKLEADGLRPAPPADRATLIRRATFDMLGVPADPADVTAFVQDRSPGAYPRVVDRLLADPRYGERWGRHWLDVARFSESQGFERDIIRDHAWPFRDYVVNSLNADKPYDQFVREQIAGDVLPGATGETIAATGFLVAGPYDEAGMSSASATLRLQVREEELEDMLGTVGQTFLGLTVNCARCHDHKFDPILQLDYYRLKAVFEGVHGGDRPAMGAQEARTAATRSQEKTRQIDALGDEIRLLEAGGRTQAELWNVPGVPMPMARWSFERDASDGIGRMHGRLHGGARIENGRLLLDGRDAYMDSAPLPSRLTTKTLEAWVVIADRDQRGGGILSIQSPRAQQFDAIVFGERQPRKWSAGSALFERTRDLDAPPEGADPASAIHMAIVYRPDNSITVYRNGVIYGASYVPSGSNAALRTFDSGDARVLIGLRHIGAGNGFLTGEILEARLYDRPLSDEQIGASFRAGPRKAVHLPVRPISSENAARLVRLRAERQQLEASSAAEALGSVVYAASPKEPALTHLLLRGDVQALGEVVSAGGVSTLGSADFHLPPDAPEAQRRLRLADWIVRPESGLAARVMVNRIWHYHFGRGIVGSPNDFGFNGEKPTHPELLEWLACQFASPAAPEELRGAGSVASPNSYRMGWKLKPLHRLILLSNTYQQSAAANPAAASRDAEDRLLWRFAPRRLEGEALRDAMLVVSGRIDWRRGGPGFRPFVETVNNSHFYSVFDKDGAEFNRRTIYRISVDSAKSPLLETLDCPDPSTKTPRRSVTTTPQQALELMNNRFVLEQARWFGERIAREAGAAPDRQVERAYQLALSRPPTSDERARAVDLVRQSGAPALCWALINSTEFLVIR